MILVTGANGFVGRHLSRSLEAQGRNVRAAVRTLGIGRPERSVVADVDAATDWLPALTGVDAIVHLAARVHVVEEPAADAVGAFRATNVAGTVKLARDAVRAGVRRFLFLSSIKVNGESTNGGPFTDHDEPHPDDAYGRSKREAEDALRDIARETGLEVVILRPPLVYGPDVKANFLRMLHWVDRGIPLPLAAVHNRRSLVYVGNLVDAIVRCLDHPTAAGETFLVDDGEPVSTPQLLRDIGQALQRPARLFPFPPALLRSGAALLGRGGDAARLLDDLVVDSSRIRAAVGWRPPFTRSDGLAATAAWFRSGPR